MLLMFAEREVARLVSCRVIQTNFKGFKLLLRRDRYNTNKAFNDWKVSRCVSFAQLKVQVLNIERFTAHQADYKLGSCPLAKHQKLGKILSDFRVHFKYVIFHERVEILVHYKLIVLNIFQNFPCFSVRNLKVNISYNKKALVYIFI